MKGRYLAITLGLMLAGFGAGAQKTTEHDELTWLGVLNQTRLSDRWGIWLDAHLRFHDNFTGEVSQFIGRAGPIFYLTDDIRLTAAYAYIHHFPAEGHKNIARPEHRPWQQIQ